MLRRHEATDPRWHLAPSFSGFTKVPPPPLLEKNTIFFLNLHRNPKVAGSGSLGLYGSRAQEYTINTGTWILWEYRGRNHY